MDQNVTNLARVIGEENLKYSSFGLVADLSVLFDAFIYCRDKEVPSSNHRSGTRLDTPRPAGFYFFTADDDRIQTWIGPLASGGSLACKPNRTVVETMQRRCTGNKIGSFRMIPWPTKGVMLIEALDHAFIAKPWVGFVPINLIPTLNPETTGIWDGINPAAKA